MEKCQRCGRQYETVYRVSDEIWSKISPKSNGAGLLCIKCADEVAREKGIELYWEAYLCNDSGKTIKKLV